MTIEKLIEMTMEERDKLASELKATSAKRDQLLADLAIFNHFLSELQIDLRESQEDNYNV